MATQNASRKLAAVLRSDAQTLFITSQPLVRYSIAFALVSVAAYMLKFVPHLDVSHAYAYLAFAGVYAREISLGLAVMAVIFGIFKLLALLPLGVAIVVVCVAILYAGV